MTKDISTIQESPFESIKHINEYGAEYWTARELLKTLGYNEFRFFKNVIEKTIDSIKSSGNTPSDHIVHVHDMIIAGKGAEREVEDYHLSRYACYLIAMNGKSNAFRSRPQSTANNKRIRRHHAGRFTDAKRKHTATRAEAKETTEKAGNRIISLRISTCANFAHTEVELSKGSVVAKFATTPHDPFPNRKQLKKAIFAK